eukprot:gene32487-17733_t
MIYDQAHIPTAPYTASPFGNTAGNTAVNGNGAVARMYSDQAKALKDKIREEHALASQNIYNATNEHVENKWSVDLHGQHVQEALKQITTLCDMFKTMPSKKLIRVVTGRGAHSKGDPKLLLAVRDWLREQGYQFTEGVGFFDVVIPAPPPRGA